MTEHGSVLYDTEGLLRLAEDLSREWLAERSEKPYASSAGPARVTTIFGLTAHVHRLAAAVMSLYRSGFTVETTPLVRAAYESALTAAWVQQVEDALPATLNRARHHQKQLRDSALRAWHSPGDAFPIPADEQTDFVVTPGSKKGAQWITELCADFEMGAQLYPVYRALSQETHPSAAVVDLYATLPEGRSIPRLHVLPHPPPDGQGQEFLLHILCSSMVWSCRAVNLIDRDRRRAPARARLIAAAARLQIAPMLRATPEAIFRGQQGERQRRRAHVTDHS